jgi:acyl-CoA synthetase (NDP forming)
VSADATSAPAGELPQPQPVARLLSPRSVAIIGVSPEPGSLGGAVLANLERFGYRGDIHLVSRSRSDVNGRPCVSSIDALPMDIDAAVLAVPRAGIMDAVAACGRRRIAGAVIFAAGFAEVDAAGRADQEALAHLARASGVAINGPNCLGFTNFIDGVALSFEPMAPHGLADRPAIGIVAQSGAMAASLRSAMLAKGIAVTYAISTGNEAVLGVEDFLAYLIEDDATRVVALFVEHIRKPRLFLKLAAAARARGKPLVLLHPGRSARARESARSHTGALAGNHAVMRTLAGREAVVLVETLDELIDTATLLACFPTPPTQGTAVMTNSGAFKGFALDFCEAIGLDLPSLSEATVERLKAALPSFASLDNPLDVTAQGIKEPRIFGDCAHALLAEPGVGSLIVSVVPGSPAQAMAKVQSLAPVIDSPPKPVAVAILGDEMPLAAEFIAGFRDKGVPFFRSPERALRALALATAYGKALAAARREGTLRVLPEIAPPPGTGTLPEYRGKGYLAALGIPVPAGALARDCDAAVATAARIGYPVVLKAQAASLAHKSDAGGVIVGIRDESALREAWGRLHAEVGRARPDLTLDGILVERMAAQGLEMAVGARRDPSWGPVLMVGLGGIWIEALEDVRLLPADLDEGAIVEELARLKAARLLAGERGAPALDVAALAKVVARLGVLMRARPEIAEIDVNPLTVYPAGQGVLALDALLVVGPAGSADG